LQGFCKILVLGVQELYWTLINKQEERISCFRQKHYIPKQEVIGEKSLVSRSVVFPNEQWQDKRIEDVVEVNGVSIVPRSPTLGHGVNGD
jgi:hypothetical protein